MLWKHFFQKLKENTLLLKRKVPNLPNTHKLSDTKKKSVSLMKAFENQLQKI